MKVRCKANTGRVLFGPYLNGGVAMTNEFCGLTVGNVYVVYAWERYEDGCVYYYVEEDSENLRMHPAPLFDVVDVTPSRFWHHAKSEMYEEWGWPELFNERHFFDRLVDGHSRERAIYQSYKTLMDEEFVSPELPKED